LTIRNDEIADALDKIATLLEIDDASPFRIRAYKNAADSIRLLDPPLAEMVAEGKDLTELQDVGAGIAKKIEEIVALGHAAFVERLGKEGSPGIFDLLRIPGIGPKRVRALRDRLGVTSIESLKAAAQDGRLREVPGFGEKTQERILRRIARIEERQGPGE